MKRHVLQAERIIAPARFDLTISVANRIKEGIQLNDPFKASTSRRFAMIDTNAGSSPDDPTPALSLEDRVRISFDQLGYPQLNGIKCAMDGDRMLLTGELSSFYLKQIAQSVAVRVPGVREVQNEIEVR